MTQDRNFVDGRAFESDVTTVPNGVVNERAKVKNEKTRQPLLVEKCCNDDSFRINENKRTFTCKHCGTEYRLDIYPKAYKDTGED
jgi:hypothetical protein